jgi:hypothetical protein
MRTVYRIYDYAGVLLYVGTSVHALLRITEHQSRTWFRKVANVTFEHYSNDEQARRVERTAIRNEHPLHNKRSGSRVRN